MDRDTIFALATPPGRSGLAVVRVSGTRALEAAREIAGDLPEHGRGLRRIRDDAGTVIDEALVLTFAQGKSFTGEAVVEFHLHGSVAVAAAVQNVLARQEGMRIADPGEFTRRAMENGRLDLAQAEGLADLLDAETEAQRLQAMRVFAGELSAICEDWRRDLLRAAALLEATIDFADEDVPVDVQPEVRSLLWHVRASMERQADGVPVAERVREGFEVAIVGRPNVGKSTLLNYLVGRDAAITSASPGTTRDVIEVRTEVAGLPVTFLDTAGLRDGENEIEAIGIERGRQRATASDMRVYILEDGETAPYFLLSSDIAVSGKSDDSTDGGGISGQTGAGVARLVRRIGEILTDRVASVGKATRNRHLAAISGAMEALRRALDGLERPDPEVEIVAADLRLAIRSVDILVGRIDVEDVLGEIFSRFCIGK